MFRILNGSILDPYGSDCWESPPAKKIAVVALSLLLVGFGVATYFCGTPYFPTTSAKIFSAAGLGGVGLMLDVTLLIYICCKRNRKRDVEVSPEEPVKIPPTLIYYGIKKNKIKKNEIKKNRLICTLGEESFKKLAKGGSTDQPAVIITKNDSTYTICAENGALIQLSEGVYIFTNDPQSAKVQWKEDSFTNDPQSAKVQWKEDSFLSTLFNNIEVQWMADSVLSIHFNNKRVDVSAEVRDLV